MSSAGIKNSCHVHGGAAGESEARAQGTEEGKKVAIWAGLGHGLHGTIGWE